MTAPPAVVVIPCFNEAHRLDGDQVLTFLDQQGVELLLVDDGSTDATPAVLAELESKDPDRVTVVRSELNVGKGEAVRRGMAEAIAAGATVVGYFDADLATPPSEMLGLLDVLVASDGVDVVIGSRVALLGRHIRRNELRHWVGRVFATFASRALGIRIYDTQCGAKVFRVTPALDAALGEPFDSRWGFDVELLGRLLSPSSIDVEPVTEDRMCEVPLHTWTDVRGSKIRASVAPRLVLELAGALWATGRRRRRVASARSSRDRTPATASGRPSSSG